MAVITISRKIASYGDETAGELSKLLNYTFVDRKMLERDLLEKGISENHLKKYDERRPGFWASLSKDRDEYFDRLREIVYGYASKGNSVFIGRGGFALLKDVPGIYSIRLTAPDSIRVTRLMKEFDWTEKQAKALIAESDNNRDGFHKCFFNAENEEPSEYNLVINTGSIGPETAAAIIKYVMEKTVTEQAACEGMKRAAELLFGQRLVNHLSFDLKLQIYFLEAEVSEKKIVLHGVADNAAVIEKAVCAAEKAAEGREVVSVLNVINRYKGSSKDIGAPLKGLLDF